LSNLNRNVSLRKYLAGGLAEVVEYLPSKCEVLSSNASAVKKKLKKKENIYAACLFKRNKERKEGREEDCKA
jgi:ABC-type Zn uptake system ZnuABC Zn-binding protein ZnuA